jgi:hypothetical protein
VALPWSGGGGLEWYRTSSEQAQGIIVCPVENSRRPLCEAPPEMRCEIACLIAEMPMHQPPAKKEVVMGRAATVLTS